MNVSKMLFFRLLETKTSEANDRKIFSKNCLIYMPDFSILFLFTSLLIFSCFSDFALVILLFFKASPIFWIFFLTISYLRVIFEVLVEIQSDKFSVCKNKLLQPFYNIPLTILGLRSTVISSTILIETLKNQNPTNQFPDCSLFPIFHISNKNLSLIKIYLYIYLGLKCIPQLFIMSLFIELYHPTGITACLSTGNIILNIALFSFSISITLPIRRTPKIFKNFYCLIFSAANKFLATICGCCANLVVFMAMFRNVQYHAFLGHLPKIIIWMIPCLMLLNTQNITRLQFVIYLFFFPLVFSFIFIHPFQDTWILHYYFMYLLIGLYDIAVLGVWTNAELTDLTCYSTLRVLQFGFTSCFGLLNYLKRGGDCNLNVKIINNDDKIVNNDDKIINNDDKIVNNDDKIVNNDDKIINNDDKIVEPKKDKSQAVKLKKTTGEVKKANVPK